MRENLLPNPAHQSVLIMSGDNVENLFIPEIDFFYRIAQADVQDIFASQQGVQSKLDKQSGLTDTGPSDNCTESAGSSTI